MFPTVKVKTQMSLSPQLVVAGKLLRAGLGDLYDLVSQECNANPALEFIGQQKINRSVSDAISSSFLPRAYSPSFEGRMYEPDFVLENQIFRQSIHQQLVDQINLNSNKSEAEIAKFLLDYLDERGFLNVSLNELADESHYDIIDLQAGLDVIHQLEPAGIGARNLRECFLLQCDSLKLDGQDVSLIRQILEFCWDDFFHRRWEDVAKRNNLSLEELRNVNQKIKENLYPYPLTLLDDPDYTPLPITRPDLIIIKKELKDKVEFNIEVPYSDQFRLRICPSYSSCLSKESKFSQMISQSEADWIRKNIERGHLVIDALAKRWKTLEIIGRFIVEYHRNVLIDGFRSLKPLKRNEIARVLNVHDSTISRTVKDKFIQLPNRRIVPIEIFFDHTLPVKVTMLKMLNGTSKKLSDREIAKRLEEHGHFIARRTVSKYRKQLNLPGMHAR